MSSGCRGGWNAGSHWGFRAQQTCSGEGKSHRAHPADQCGVSNDVQKLPWVHTRLSSRDANPLSQVRPSTHSLSGLSKLPQKPWAMLAPPPSLASAKAGAPGNQDRPGEGRLAFKPRQRDREPTGLALAPGRPVLPTQTCHFPQAGEGVLQAATLLGVGPVAPQRLLHLDLVHVQQGIQCELAEDLLRKHRKDGQRAGEQSGQPWSPLHPPRGQGWAPLLSGRGQVLAGPPPRSLHLSEDTGSQLSPPPPGLPETAAEVDQKLQGQGGGRKKKTQKSYDEGMVPACFFLFLCTGE